MSCLTRVSASGAVSMGKLAEERGADAVKIVRFDGSARHRRNTRRNAL